MCFYVFIQRPWPQHEEAQQEAPNSWGIIGTGLIPIIELEPTVGTARLFEAAERTHNTRKRAIELQLHHGLRDRAALRRPISDAMVAESESIISTRRGCDAMGDSRLASNDAEN